MKLSVSSVLLMFIPLFVTPILSRLYTPEDYAAWGIFSSTYYIISAFICLSYEHTIVKSNEPEEVPNLVALSFIVCLSITALLVVVFSVGKWANLPYFRDFPSIPLLVLLILATTSNKICGSMANREKRYGMMSAVNLVNGSSQAGFRILFGCFPIVSYGLLVGNATGHFIAAILLLIGLRDVIFSKAFIKSISWKEIKYLAVKNKKFPLFDMPARLVEFAMANLTLIILSFFYVKAEIGCYSMVVQFLLIPITMVGSAMAGVFYREISENRSDAVTVSNTTRRAAKITFVISIVPALFLSLGGDKLLVIILGSQWVAAGKMALCLAVYSIPLILSEPLLPVFRALDKQEIRFKWNLVNSICSFSALILAALFVKDLFIVLIAYALCYGIIRLIMFFQVLRVSGVTLKSISPFFVPVIMGTYMILAIRLIISVL